MGDFNARTTNNKANILCFKEDNNPIWLIEKENPQWVWCSEDDKVRNHFLEGLLTLCVAFKLIISNGIDGKGPGSSLATHTMGQMLLTM